MRHRRAASRLARSEHRKERSGVVARRGALSTTRVDALVRPGGTAIVATSTTRRDEPARNAAPDNMRMQLTKRLGNMTKDENWSAELELIGAFLNPAKYDRYVALSGSEAGRRKLLRDLDHFTGFVTAQDHVLGVRCDHMSIRCIRDSAGFVFFILRINDVCHRLCVLRM